MPIEIKPLFRPDVLRQRIREFTLPTGDPAFDAARQKLRRWADVIRSGQVDRLNERELLPDFLADIFARLLGYVPPPGEDGKYTLSRERHVEVEGEFADAVLGRFNGEPQYVVAVEGKGPRDPLDRPHAGRRRSAVEQAYKYAINLPCDWVLVTNIRQVRLYSKNADQQTYERFDTERLAEDDTQLRKFVFLLGNARVLPPGGKCHLYDLREASEKAGREVTDAYYRAYAEIRRDAFERLRNANPQLDAPVALAATQKLLDRLLFVAFSEDRGLLPPETIRRAFEHADPYNPRPVWDNFRGLFRAIDEGRDALRIPRYNGGLFAPDPVVDAMAVPDEVCKRLAELGAYEYRPPSEVAQEAADATEDGEPPLVDVDILGHIFEQSITDLERLQGEVAQDGDGAADTRKRLSRRRREGLLHSTVCHPLHRGAGIGGRAPGAVRRATEPAPGRRQRPHQGRSG